MRDGDNVQKMQNGIEMFKDGASEYTVWGVEQEIRHKNRNASEEEQASERASARGRRGIGGTYCTNGGNGFHFDFLSSSRDWTISRGDG